MFYPFFFVNYRFFNYDNFFKVFVRGRKMECLHDKILVLSSKNFFLNQEISVIEPRLKSMYKTCHLFEVVDALVLFFFFYK